MKTKILIFASMFAVVTARAQTYEQAHFVLKEEIHSDSNIVYEATTSIKLLAGFRCDPDKDASVVLSINRFNVCLPEEGLLGGPPTSNHDGVVGALPGELNVSDFGGAVYSIPIIMPHGIGDMTPKIAVTYNNQTGNGLLGWGWNLSGLSSIVRTGQTLFHDNNETAVNFVDDRYIIDGKRLMLCSGSYGANGSVYKTEIDEMSKIVAYSEGYSGPSRFVVYKKDGTIWEYGGTDDSRIEPQHRDDVVLTWLVNKISDRDGNCIVFNYIENQDEGEWLPNSIDYTLNNNAKINEMFRIGFAYDDRSDVEFGYESENMVKRTKILKNITVNNMMTGTILYDYSFGYIEPGNYDDSQYFMYYRLRTVGLSANGMKLNPTVISWNDKKKHYPDKFESYSLSKNVFNKVPFVGDFNGDGYSDVALVPYKTGSAYQYDVWVELYLNNGDGTFENTPFFSFELDKSLEWLYVVDLDGDGLDDLVPYFVDDDTKSSWKSKIYAYLNQGDTFLFIGEKQSDKYFTPYSGDFCHERKTSFFVEYVPDAYGMSYYPEIVFVEGNHLYSQNLGQPAFACIAERVFVADLDSDGRSEIMLLNNGYAKVAKISKENGQYVFNCLYDDDSFNSDDFMFPGDFNGDGHVDVLKYNESTYWQVAISDGNRLQTPVSCMAANLLGGFFLVPQDYYHCSLQNLSMPSITIRTADFDGDGKTDVAVFKSTGGNYYTTIGFRMYEEPDGRFSFSDIRRFYFNINNSHQYVHVGRFLGRENESILGSVRSNPYTNEIPKIISFFPHSAKYSVERITDGLGNARGFKYEYLMPNNPESMYGYDYQWVNCDTRTVSLPVRVLCRDTVFSANNNPCVMKYSYTNMLYNNTGRGFLGFESKASKLFINNVLYAADSVARDMDLFDEYHVLLPKTYFKYNYNNQIVKTEQYTFNVCLCAENTKVIMPLLICKNTVDYDDAISGAIVRTKVENVDYQSDMSAGLYADVVNVLRVVSGEDAAYNGTDAESCSYWSKLYYLYNNKIEDWVVSRPQSIVKSQHYNDNEIVGSTELFDYSNGNPYQITHKVVVPNADMNYDDHLKIVSDYSYDAVGHAIIQTLTSPSSKNQRVTQKRYGEEYNYRLPTTSINEKGWEVNNTYDSDYGSLLASLDYNQFETECSSDPFEITVENILPGGVRYVKTKRWADSNEHAPNNAMYYCWEKTSGNAETLVFYGKTGKKLREVSMGLHGEPVYVDFNYDDKGNLTSKSNPYKIGDNVVWCYYVYDNNNRLSEEVFPNGLTKTYSYNRLQTTVCSTSPEGVLRTVIETMNPMGWRTQVVDIGGNTINYEYFSDGKLKSAMIGKNTSTKVQYEYDNARNVSRMKDPSCGEVLYEYNAFGELVSTRNTKQCVTTYDYDLLGNVVTRSETDAKGANTVVTQWVYDNKKGQMGMLSQVIYGQSHVVSYNYDDLLRVTNVDETINGTLYSTRYTYDNANREECVIYPSGLTVQKKYSNSGLYLSMVDASNDKVLWRAENANAMGYVTDYQYGNGLKTQRKYDETSNLLDKIFTFNDDEVYQNLNYSYDGFGNLVNRTKKNGIAKSESFVYDEFNRLVEIRMNNSVTGGMLYDDYGNILSKTANKKDVFYEAQYYADNPYAINKAKSNNDNLIAANQTIEYTPFDKMSNIYYGDNSLTIDYGCDHERVHSEEIVGGVKKEKVYVGDCEYVSIKGRTTIYTYLRGQMGVYAVCCTDEKGENSIMYIHPDHLNSWCMITDENGEIIQNVSFDAWGNARDGDTWSGKYKDNLMCDRGFTGHEHLTDFGIINMNGRAYDPIMSMMMSPDSNIQNLDFSQNYNRYSYCYNNPLSYSDPSGEWIEWLLYGMFNGTVNVICNMDDIDSFAEGLLSFGAGFISGCLSHGLMECSWAWQVVGGVVGGTLKTGVNGFVRQNTGDELDWDVLDNSTYKDEVLYAFGSSLAKSVLTSYFVSPTDDDDGKNLCNMLCKEKHNQNLLLTASKRIAGNIFAGRKVFSGFGITKDNLEDIVPYLECAFDMVTDNVTISASSETLSKINDKLLEFDFKGTMRNFGKDADYCYSQLRSLFLKKNE